MADHLTYMLRCLQLAEKAKSFVAPNPMVGAIIVHEGRILAEGWHRQYGQPHAEVNCLEAVKQEDRHLIPASTMYVSLEPCAHHGKTPPCTLRLVQENIKQVVICNVDPFEKVSGRGLDMLREAGIDTETGILEEEGRWLNRRFFCFHEQKRPYIILKWAQTRTGYFAPLDRSRFQVSNIHSRQLVHKWRTEEAAIMVGYRTALNDDPLLTARLWQARQPLRIVVDRDLSLPTGLNIFNKEANTWIINEMREGVEGNIGFIRIGSSVDFFEALMERLYQAGVTSLLVEGGADLLNTFIGHDLWDEARVFTSPAQLDGGIQAPLLEHARGVLQSALDSDELNVYTHKNSPFAYKSGMEL